MSAKVTTVRLRAWDGVRDFPLEQAERLLSMDVRGGSGWTLADERYEYTEGVLRRKAAKKDNND